METLNGTKESAIDETVETVKESDVLIWLMVPVFLLSL